MPGNEVVLERIGRSRERRGYPILPIRALRCGGGAVVATRRLGRGGVFTDIGTSHSVEVALAAFGVRLDQAYSGADQNFLREFVAAQETLGAHGEAPAAVRAPPCRFAPL